jgi:hypothetical protein
MRRCSKVITGKLFLATVLPLLIAMIGCAGIQTRDSGQQKFDFTKIKSVIILPFVENYRSSTDSLFVPVKTTENIYESADIIAMAMFEAGIKVVDRMFLEKILSEQKLSLSGLMEQQDYRKIGNLVNADAILWGTIQTTKLIAQRTCNLSVRLIDVETGTVIYTSLSEKKDPWAGLDTSSMKSDLIAEAGRKLKEFLQTHR